MKKKLPRRTLILGGSSSGKSKLAETLVFQAGLARHYIATAQAFDDEMRAKIAAHRAQRGADWTTHDAPHDLAAAIAGIPADAVTLLDCATMWLSNQLLADRPMAPAKEEFLASCAACASPLVIVSNEVGHGIVPEYPLGRKFRDAQGRLNQALAADADLVVFVTAGLPQVLKGELP